VAFLMNISTFVWELRGIAVRVEVKHQASYTILNS
jgi:hypothetical protein